MALIKCPECGREISDLSNECIHCGFPLKKVADGELVSIVDNLSTITEETKIEAYDVMLVDYGDAKLTTANNLRKLLDITYKEAYNILATLPTYIYNDIPQGDAEYIARKLMNMNMRVAVYDPVGNVRYYEPPKYINRPLPIVAPIPRVRRIVRPNPIIHFTPIPSPSPIVINVNKGPVKKSTPKRAPSTTSIFGTSARKSPAPKASSSRTTKNTAPSTSRPKPSSSSRTVIKPAASRSTGNRLGDQSRRGKR